MDKRDIITVLLSGGSGKRTGRDMPKQYISAGGCMMITRSLKALTSHPDIRRIRIVADRAWQDKILSEWKEQGIDAELLGFSLPGETRQDMLETAGYLGRLDPVPDGVKLHMLQILRGTKLAEEYLKDPFPLMTLDEYCDLIISCLQLLDPKTVIHRMTGDGPKSLLIAPEWCADKKKVINTLYKRIAQY